ncbi:glucose 1-dehydrogenase [Phreatobacter stygius]|uniref:Glucose 1-dehydrogenase n=1 Tax=Phreatobacter stygius TaxID=1940610 RepID=A0A4D7B9Z5_9HYPH|nr:glucose 1-dehydrogenase [Phreatobacter stygius]QCI64907.1 glucose 1-dehydrogenase [Phreatobacter stygius]
MALTSFDLSGRRALITGSSTGIGLAYAQGLAEAGAAIVLNGRDRDKLAAAAAGLAAQGFTVSSRAFDVTDQPAAAAVVDAIEREDGPIDILVNNAGTTFRAPLDEFPEEAWRRVMATNLDSAFYVSKAVARHMIPRGRGKIINTCSVTSEIARPTIAAYVTSKGALKMLTKAMAVDWAKHGIRVNGIGPGYFKTELNESLYRDEVFTAWVASRTPLGRWGELEELQGACVFLASRASDYVTGHVLYVDGGMTASV